MGLLDWLKGRKRAPPGVARQSVEKLRRELMAVNRRSAPFRVRDGEPEGVDLVAEWKIVDAQWYEIFAKAGIERTFKVMMKFDSGRGEVRAVDQAWLVEWRAGVPEVFLETAGFRGRSWEMSFEKAWAFREDGSYGKVYDYRFSTAEIKNPLIEAAHKAGWGWRNVAFGRL